MVNGTEYELTYCMYQFGRVVSHKGVSTTKIHAGIITIVLRDPAGERLMAWMAGPHKSKDGEIKFTATKRIV